MFGKDAEIVRYAAEQTNERLIAAGFPNVALAYDGLHFEVHV